MKLIVPILLFMLLFVSCQSMKKYNQIIQTAKILDVKSGKTAANQNFIHFQSALALVG